MYHIKNADTDDNSDYFNFFSKYLHCITYHLCLSHIIPSNITYQYANLTAYHLILINIYTNSIANKESKQLV